MNQKKIDELMQRRHQFIYSKEGEERLVILKYLEDLYPVKYKEDSPMAIYLDSIGLPLIEDNNISNDNLKLKTIAREYLNLTIAINILNKIKKDIDSETLNNIIPQILSFISVNYLDEKYSKITSLDELLIYLQYSKILYLNEYQKHIINSETIKQVDIPIKSLDLNSFINHTKRMLRNNSHFNIFASLENEISLVSMQAINGIVSTKYNRDILMKVVCEPGKWLTYKELNGHNIEYIHDYGIVELDDSYNNYKKLQKIKR